MFFQQDISKGKISKVFIRSKVIVLLDPFVFLNHPLQLRRTRSEKNVLTVVTLCENSLDAVS